MISFVEVRDNLTFDLDHSDLTASVSEMSQEARSLNDNIPTQYEQPLYPGAKVTIGAVMVLLSLFTIRHDVTGDAYCPSSKITFANTTMRTYTP